MKIFFDIQDRHFLGANTTNAVSKPRSDTQRTLERLGFKSVIAGGDFSLEGKFPKNLKERIVKKLNRWQFGRSLKMALRCVTMNGDTEIFVQYPFLSDRMYDVLSQMKSCGCQITVLFHDFYTLREKRENDIRELSLLRLADVVIAHSKPMADVFKAHGCTAEIRILGCFDYLLSREVSEGSKEVSEGSKEVSEGSNGFQKVSEDIVFAGNLDKSAFISRLGDIGTDIHLYGRKPTVTLPFGGFRPLQGELKGSVGRGFYEGSFPAERPVGVKGTWGLVWDGDSTDGCTGLMGDYLRYNSPFKFSLYLSIGKPVIVWSQSALAGFVQEQHLGIVVDTLSEIPTRISALTAEQINEIQESVGRVGHDLRTGKQLERILGPSPTLP